ncbi:MAG: T9SS type A sorting domain-containing protein [Aureispira sp.]
MKKIITLFITSLTVLLFGTSLTAQTCCGAGTTAPELTPGFYTTGQIAGNNNTLAPVLGVNASADLPRVEYIVTKRGVPARYTDGRIDTTGGGGDVVLGADVDGIFMPQNMTRYGVTLVSGDTFDITAVGYDLPVLQNLADSLLNGTTATGVPCCNLFNLLATLLNNPPLAGFCDSLNNAGITSSADLTNMNDILPVFDAFADGSISIGNIVSTLNVINQNGSFLSADCGGTGANDFLFFGLNRLATYGYEVGNVIAVRELSAVSSFMIFPNPANKGNVHVYCTTKEAVDLQVNLIDATGRVVYQKTVNGILGNSETTIPVGNLTPGFYMVELTDGYSNQTQKLIVR